MLDLVAGLDSIGMLVIDAAVRYAKPVEYIVASLLLGEPVGSSESSGTRQISGTGGQLDFVCGAQMACGGKAFICMSSTHTDKNGVMHSRIVPTFSGDIITTPRSLAFYIATEYGVVNLAGLTTWERADAMISIAHPNFRDELIKAAEANRIWLPSNKR